MRSLEYSWFALSNVQGFGAKSIHYIFSILQQQKMTMPELFELDISQLENMLPELGKGRFSRAKISNLFQLDEDNLFDSFEKLKSEKVFLITMEDERYPKHVLENMQDNAPPILFCKGYLPLLNTKGVSIVGARDVDEFVVTLTKGIASRLSEHGFNVTSGYAKGVDTSAHLGALEAQGTTTMILSFGVNHISIKKEFKELDWERNSLFVSQFNPYEKFTGQNAMMRNKLVSAMSKAIVVMASGPEKDSNGKMSGTFDAAKGAMKMNIPVFVLSPDVLKPAPQGNIDLVKLGAIPFTNGNDIVKFLEEQPLQTTTTTNDKKAGDKKEPAKLPIQTSLF
ncbi:MAG: DNA-protecting protein DprA [Bacteroidetes bacterium]|nr:DNA-protecting protein DprA [Bacteroidota bacterium]